MDGEGCQMQWEKEEPPITGGTIPLITNVEDKNNLCLVIISCVLINVQQLFTPKKKAP